jgi:hypothetical protein
VLAHAEACVVGRLVVDSPVVCRHSRPFLCRELESAGAGVVAVVVARNHRCAAEVAESFQVVREGGLG